MTTFNLTEAVENEEASTPSLERAVKMGELMATADKEVKRLTDELKEAKKKYNAIAMDSLPELLKEIGVNSVELSDGTKIEVRSDLSASITKAKHDIAMKWLIDNDYGGIIKTNVTVAFGAEPAEQEQAAELTGALLQTYDGVSYKAAVHPATLKSFVKERLAAGEELPLDLFSVHQYSIATLTTA